MLTNQTKWHRVEPHLPEIDKIFFDYDPDAILKTEPEYFCKGLFAIKYGNMSTKAQMMLYSFHQKRQETLAEYYYRTNRHLLGSIKVAEYDPERDNLQIIRFDV